MNSVKETLIVDTFIPGIGESGRYFWAKPSPLNDQKGLSLAPLRSYGILRRGGRWRGAVADAEYHSDMISLETGDAIVMYTDGITESVNSEGEWFCNDRLHMIIRKNAALPAPDIMKNILLAVSSFVGELPTLTMSTRVFL